MKTMFIFRKFNCRRKCQVSHKCLENIQLENIFRSWLLHWIKIWCDVSLFIFPKSNLPPTNDFLELTPIKLKLQNTIINIIRSIEEINRSISKGMSNIYFSSSYWEKLTFSKLQFSKFKKFVTRSVFDELQIMQISLNFKTSCCKKSDLGARACVAFPLF